MMDEAPLPRRYINSFSEKGPLQGAVLRPIGRVRLVYGFKCAYREGRWNRARIEGSGMLKVALALLAAIDNLP